MTHLSLRTALLAGTFAAFASPALAQQAEDDVPGAGAIGAGTMEQQPVPGGEALAGDDPTLGEQSPSVQEALPAQDTTLTGEDTAPGQAPAAGQDTALGATPPVQREPSAAAAQDGVGPESVRRIQEALNQAGHDAGAADGLWGPQTRGAMTAFQQSQGLEPTGLINLRSLEALGLTDLAAQLEGQVGPGQAAAEPGTPAVQPGMEAEAPASGTTAAQPGAIGAAPAGDAGQVPIEEDDAGEDVTQ